MVKLDYKAGLLQYIKTSILLDSPFIHKTSICVIEEVATAIYLFMIEDDMSVQEATELAIYNEFGDYGTSIDTLNTLINKIEIYESIMNSKFR
jgi:hypothetical protein